jgi:hypothetical protein
LFISQAVLRECQAGDPDAAAQRLEVLRDLPLLEQTEAATALAQTLLEQVPLPERAAVDALHIAIAAVHGMDYLLTWELYPHRQRGLAGPNRVGLSRQRLRTADDLYPR